MIPAIMILAALFVALAAAPSFAQRARQQGYVYDSNSKPLANIKVVFDRIGSTSGKTHLEETTDAEGRFVFANINGGQWRLTIQTAGYMPFTQVYNVSSLAANPNLTITLQKIEQTPAADDKRKELQALVDETTKLADEGKFDDALAKLDTFMATEDNKMLHLLKAEVLEKKGDSEGAKVEIEMVLEAEPNNATALKMIGDICIRAMDYVAAKDYYLRLATARPNDAAILYTAAETCFYTDDYQGSIDLYARALTANPSLVDAEMKIGFAYIVLKDCPNAVKHFENFIKMAPSHPAVPEVQKEIEKCKTAQ
jgi:tetratricopeptide (TPR) repeat protein